MTTAVPEELNIQQQVVEVANPPEVENTAGKEVDTRMDGDFSPAEQEGREYFKNLMEAMEKGEDLPEDESATAPEVEAAKPEDAPAPAVDEEALSGEILALSAQATELAGKLDEAEGKIIDLGDQLENGEINQAKYEIEKRRLMREIESIESGQLTTAKALEDREAALQEASTASNPWFIASTAFLNAPGNEVFNSTGEHYEGLKNAIQFAAGLKANEGKTPAEILAIASNAYRAMTGMSAQAPAAAPPAKTPKPQPNIPPTLGMMQAAMPNNDDSPYGFLTSLSGSAYEAAYSKLTPDQREAFLDSLS